MTGVTRLRERLALGDFALLAAVSDLERSVATAHLWLEEYVSGDTVPEGEIDAGLERARRLAAVILEGGAADGGRYRLEPMDDAGARSRAAAVRTLLDQFGELSRRRREGFARGAEVGIGSPLDVEVDRAFRQLFEETAALERVLVRRMNRNRDRAQRLLLSVVAAWIVLLAAGVVGLAIVQRRRRATEAALHDSELQLLQAQKMEAVGRLAGGISHDINNYLAAITAQCERVKMKAAPGDPTAARMEEAIQTAFKASSLIRRLLAFSRRQPVRREVIDLNTVVSDLEPMIRRLLGDDVRLETGLAPGLWNVEIDPAQLEQVIVNLVVNAREAIPGGGRVRIDTANLDAGAGLEAGERVALAVGDTGSGILPAVRDKIFEPFFTTKEESGSSGLGLATVYGIVTQHDGRIRVDSEPGAGTTFTLDFPRSSAPAPAPRRAERKADLPRGSEAVLLIEDNDDVRRSAQALLAELGYRVDAAGSGAEALATFERAGGGFDLVISDVVMPDQSGPEVVDLLRERKPQLRVLFISGTSGKLILHHGLRRGEFDLLEKPFSLDTLAHTIRDILDRTLV